MDNEHNQKTIKDHEKDGMVSIVSRNAGWITVTPEKMNRKRPFEKQGVGNDATVTSILTPSWM